MSEGEFAENTGISRENGEKAERVRRSVVDNMLCLKLCVCRQRQEHDAQQQLWEDKIMTVENSCMELKRALKDEEVSKNAISDEKHRVQREIEKMEIEMTSLRQEVFSTPTTLFGRRETYALNRTQG